MGCLFNHTETSYLYTYGRTRSLTVGLAICRRARVDVAVRGGGNGGRMRARPTAFLPPHQGEDRGGGGLPVSRIVVEPVRTETHPHPTLPLKGRADRQSTRLNSSH